MPNARAESRSAPQLQAARDQVSPESWLDRLLGFVPRVLSSHLHIILLTALGIYLVVLPLVGVAVSAKAELIGGNYTNVTSDLGACIAAGLTVHLVRRDRHRAQQVEELLHRLHASHQSLQDGIEKAASAAARAQEAAERLHDRGS